MEYQVDPLALILPFLIVVCCHGHMHRPGYNCSSVCIVSKELPVVTRTHVGGDLCPGDLLAGTEWVVWHSLLKRPKGTWGHVAIVSMCCPSCVTDGKVGVGLR